MELVEEFKKKYSREEEKEVRQQEKKEKGKTFSRELPERYMVKLLYRQGNKKYDREYWRQMKNWRQWKKNPFSRYNRNTFLKRMEEEKHKYKGGMVEEWNEEEDKKDQQRIEEDKKYLEELENENLDIGDLRDPYDEL